MMKPTNALLIANVILMNPFFFFFVSFMAINRTFSFPANERFQLDDDGYYAVKFNYLVFKCKRRRRRTRQ